VFEAFVRAVRLHHQLILRVLADEGIHPGQAMCLRAVARHDGLSQRELADALFVGAPTVTTMLQRMERHGMVERRPDPGDQRVTRVHLTAEGRRRAAAGRAAMATHASRALDPIPARQRRALERLLAVFGDHLAAALEADVPDADPDGSLAAEGRT
jgi:DNA-binding MarR family transcriptional regulator